MYKKIIKIFSKSMLFLFVYMITIQACFSVVVEVEALESFSSINPSKTLHVVSKEKAEFDNGIVWEPGTVIEGQILDVKQPKRGKRNASFKFFPLNYTYENVTKTNYNDTFIGKYASEKEIDKKKIAISAATTAGGLILQIPLFSQCVSFTKGVVVNPENNRFKSGAVQVYKDSPVSYIEEGKDIILSKGDTFFLKFKTDDTEDYPNKSHMLEVDSPQSYSNSGAETSTDVQSMITIPTENPEDVLHEAEEGLR